MTRLTKHEANTLWARWRHHGDHHAREQLIHAHKSIINLLAYRAAQKLPAHIDKTDLVSAGTVALITSIDRYDPTKGATFEQFVWTRISGAILDELRSMDWASRPARRNIREIERAVDRWFMWHGRMPSNTELAAELGITVRELHNMQMDEVRADTRSLNAPVAQSDLNDIVEVIDTVEDTTSDPCQIIIARDVIRRALACLPERERYVFGRTVAGDDLATIGSALGVTDTRVSHMKKRMLYRMREEIAAA